MVRVEQSIEVKVPIRTAYNQWTQFTEFPQFMDKVEEVQQLDDKRLHWRASLAGKTEEWDAVISEQIPDERIAWTSTSTSETMTFINTSWPSRRGGLCHPLGSERRSLHP